MLLFYYYEGLKGCQVYKPEYVSGRDTCLIFHLFVKLKVFDFVEKKTR